LISVIIPTLNEETHIRACIENVRTESGVCEIIVVDGGSSDRTVELAGKYPEVRIVESVRGRGLQMNAGASCAKGRILLFLHADTGLQDGWAREVISSTEGLVSGGTFVSGGAFTFKIDNPKVKYRLVEQWVKCRCSVFKLPYGDQGIFIRRDIFDRIGGYCDIPLMEDVDLVDRMKKIGKIVILRQKALTSDRRWTKRGVIHTSLLNQLITVLYRLGFSPHRLARLYYRKTAKDKNYYR
jgi:rSAM/selenodomain-associated transferase 2